MLDLVAPAEFEYWEDYQTLKENINVCKRDIVRLENDIANIRVNDICPSCGQTIDTSHLEKVKADLQDQLDTNKTLQEEDLIKATKWSNEIKDIDDKKRTYETK